MVKKGDAFSYEELVRRYEGKLLRFVRRWLKDAKDAEEVVQDSLFKLHRSINKIEKDRKFSSYLYAIAKNESISKIRGMKDTLPLYEDIVGANEEEVYERIINKERSNFVRRGLRKLNEIQRRVLKMYFFEELSYKKIHHKLGLPLNTVKTVLRRSKLKLAKVLRAIMGK